MRAQKASPSDSGESPEIPPLLPYEPPRDDQIIVWKEEEGKPLSLRFLMKYFAQPKTWSTTRIEISCRKWDQSSPKWRYACTV
jgi:hypothetical protein